MKYITITADTYEDALRDARSQYGDAIRIHSRKDIDKKCGLFGLGKKSCCELTFFMSDYVEVKNGHSSENSDLGASPEEIALFEMEAKTPDPATGVYRSADVSPVQKADSEADSVTVSEHSVHKPLKIYQADEEDEQSKQESLNTALNNTDNSITDIPQEIVDRIVEILKLNDFSDEFSKMLIGDIKKILVKALPDVPDEKTLELLVLDKIIGSIKIDVNTQIKMPKFFVLLGPTGIGKTTTIAKIAAIYGTLPSPEDRKDVSIITLDSFRIGAYEQMEAFGDIINIPVYRADNRASFSEAIEQCSHSDLILVDTMGKSPRDDELYVRLRNMLHALPSVDTGYYLGLNASMKTGDIEVVYTQFRDFDLSGCVITKTDESATIGNILSICWKKNLPIIFMTDGQKVPSCIHQASNKNIIALLKGFRSIDVDNTLLDCNNL